MLLKTTVVNSWNKKLANLQLIIVIGSVIKHENEENLKIGKWKKVSLNQLKRKAN